MSTAPPVHFYIASGLTFADRIMCGNPDKGINTHVTEYGNQVTCETCKALMHAAMKHDDEGESPWPS